MEWRESPWTLGRVELFLDGMRVAFTQPCPLGTFVRVHVRGVDIMVSFGQEQLAQRYAEQTVRGVVGRRGCEISHTPAR